MEAPTEVVVSRTAAGWRAELDSHAALSADSLAALDRRVRQLLGGEPVVYQFHTGNVELDRLVRRIRIARAAVRRYEARTRSFTDQALLLRSGTSQRDLGILLGLSYQRVSQLIERQRVLAAG